MPVGINLSLSFKETEYLVKGSPLLNNLRTNTGKVPTLGTAAAITESAPGLGG
jgi:hypothetical protein